MTEILDSFDNQKQKEELAVLESIYLQDIDILKSVAPFKFNIICKPYFDSETLGHQKDFVKIQIELSKKYPEDYPKFRFYPNDVNFNQQKIVEMEIITKKIMDLNRGFPMIYDIVESIRAYLQEKIAEEYNVYKKVRKISEEIEEANEKKIVRTSFTPVTIENFNAWNKKFIEEMKELKKKKNK